jgi:hypothetical protein
MNTAGNPTVEFTLRCEASDPYDASIRLLNDAQRFGAELVSLHFAASERILSLTVRVPPDVDRSNLANRLGRHLAVLPVPALSSEH